MDRHTREQLIARYKDGYRVVAAALEGAIDAELDATPAPGKWSAREIVHHLADSEMTSAIRLRLLLAEEHAAIRPYDQELFARRLYYDRPIAASLQAFQAARTSTAELLDRLTESEWAREGTHPEHGRYGVERWLEVYGAHAHNHADQITRARASARTRK
jgi:DinB family protein